MLPPMEICCWQWNAEKFCMGKNNFSPKGKIYSSLCTTVEGLSNGLFRKFLFWVVPNFYITKPQKVSKQWFLDKKSKLTILDNGVVSNEGYILFFTAVRMAYSEFFYFDFLKIWYMVMKNFRVCTFSNWKFRKSTNKYM